MAIDRRSVLLGGVGMACASAFGQSAKLAAGKPVGKWRVGQSLPLTGDVMTIGVSYYGGAQAYFSALEKKGGAGAPPIQFLSYDDKYDPKRTLENAKKLIADGTDVLFGFVGTSQCEAVLPLIKQTDAVFFAPYSGAQSLRDASLRNVFHVRAGVDDEALTIVRHCSTIGIKRLAMFADDDGLGRSGLDGVNRAIKNVGADPLIAVRMAPPNSTDVKAAVQAIVKADPQGVIQAGTFKTSAAFIREARKAGYNGLFLVMSVVGIDYLIVELGKEAAGVVVSQVMPSPEKVGIPVVKEYQNALIDTESGYQPTYEGLEGFIAAKTLAEGMRRAGKPSRAALQHTLESMTDYNVGGFRVNLRPKQYDAVRTVELVSISASGRIVR